MLLAPATFPPYQRTRMLFAFLDAGLLAAGAAAPEAITVDFNATFLVVAGLIAALTLVLKPLLFDPMLHLFEEREKRIDGARVQARRIDERSANALTTYETEMSRARAAAHAERDKIRAEGLKREQEILESVRQATTKVIDEGKRAAQAAADRARVTTKADAAALARDVAARLLGREVQP
jgi:F-type H+-transporting ATPase subunit b